MAVDTTNAFNFNRYAYANNSPYKFTDPDGRQACDGITTCRVATEELAVARGEMTQEQKEANDAARGVGAIIAAPIAAAIILAPEAVAPAAIVGKKVGSGISRQTTKQLEKSRDSLKDRVEEHVKKLDDYKRNPDKFDNQGTLANAPSQAVREKVIAGRIKALEGQIKKNEGELRKVEEQLRQAAE